MPDLQYTLNEATPPDGLSPPLQAMWWLKKGNLEVGPEWDRAHEICQSNEGDPAHDRVHALAHRIEGDDWNADYWYRRAGQARAGQSCAEEWDLILSGLAG